MDHRVILYHKQATSARLRFLLTGEGSVCLFQTLPALSQLLEDEPGNTVVHPAAILAEAERWLDLAAGTLRAKTGFRYSVDVPGERVQVVLAAIESVDPPFDEAEKVGAKFIDLTQVRGLPQVELELLRKAYELVLG
ncbi:MAG: hypothetical protein ABW131_01915 [Candidatus Sedimenticola sp. 6PFRAG5]